MKDKEIIDYIEQKIEILANSKSGFIYDHEDVIKTLRDIQNKIIRSGRLKIWCNDCHDSTYHRWVELPAEDKEGGWYCEKEHKLD